MTKNTEELFKIMEEMRIEKKKLEAKLTFVIGSYLDEFTENTGLHIASVDVRLSSIETVSAETTAYLVTEVYCGIII